MVESPFDAHLHLRQPGQLLELVINHAKIGGVETAYVMPNTVPPIRTVEDAVKYRALLEKLEPNVNFLVSIYLSRSLTTDEIRKAKSFGITGIKSYPRGVTTNSKEGIESYEIYYDLFKVMEEEDLILNLHGELPCSDFNSNISVLNAEEKFLPQLIKIHKNFPKLRVILEHATTRAAVETVKSCGDTVGCTITAHHLTLTVDDWAGDGLNFCKPVAKLPEDREALREIIRQGHPRFFLGSDSAPHPIDKKLPNSPNTKCAAGIYTSINLIPLLATIFESALPPPMATSNLTKYFQDRRKLSPIPLSRFNDFVSKFGRRFYKIKHENLKMIKLIRRRETSEENLEDYNSSFKIRESFDYSFDVSKSSSAHFLYETEQEEGVKNYQKTKLIPFWGGKVLNWRVEES
ncbi:hypothetical protein BY996DRAFT_6431673 [Phakopsora pachyrhizi]|uniref:Dihydroorotase n=1 Tax=Phakopsora pachyrhizi TaxID=170000 RepID=A0AAV0BNV6_PHAPC|nr:hypothetical protein BY996DRAFT_6431673 [Phakopsora pachyrhizi]CAH7688977.1 hypothetical protein PPACK8108_LOCUS24026 [Phakopsora pachyrhizi]